MLQEATHISHYRLLRRIGGGGMGDVYLAENLHLNVQIAIKVIKPAILSNPDARRLFLREARTAATLDHPYILPLFDYGEATIDGDIYPYMVMPLRLEGSLKTWLKQYGGAGRLSLAAVVEMVSQAASALQHAHDRQIIHLDVKPSNFLLRSTAGNLGTPDLLLADFGLAKVVNTEVSMSHTSRGTPSYMAPEQWRGCPVAATDQYALASMTYEMLTGRPPFLGNSPEALMYQHLNTSPEPPSTFNPHLSKEVDEVLLHALAKCPEDRFATIAAFANALRQAAFPEDTDPRTLPSPLLRATLVISQAEARTGTSRSLDLPGAQQVKVDIPAGVHDGQVMRLSVQSKAAGHASPDQVETLMLTISIRVGTPGDEPGREKEKRPIPLSPGAWALAGLALVVALTSVGIYLLVGEHHGQATGASTTTRTTVTATAPAPSPSTTATAAAEQNLYRQATSGIPVLDDPLVNNSLGNEWDEIPTVTQGGTCAFIDGAYHVTQDQSDVFYRCIARHTDYGDFAFQVQATIQTGDEAGIVFRFDRALLTFYAFHISTDGAYRLDVDNRQGFVRTLSSGTSPAIKIGHNRPTLITVVAQGPHLTIFVDTHDVTAVTDSTYSRGSIGVMAQDDYSATNVAFTNAKVWLLQP
jgi:serine/threonine protein kinase